MKLSKISGLLFGVILCHGSASALAAPSAGQEALANADAGFAFLLLKQIAKEQPGKNIFISPFSVSSVLQMMDNGAAGETRREMEQVLGTSGLTLETVNQAYQQLNQSISQETNATLTIANSLWYRKGFELKPSFVSCNQEFYGAKIGALDFADPSAVRVINDWADTATRGRIQDIISPPLDALTRVILANAIYFKGTWEHKFDRSLTKPRAFHLADGGEKQVPMMQQRRRFFYRHADGFQAVRLPYAGGRLAMYVLLPDTGSDVEDLLSKLNATTWQDGVVRLLRESEGTLILPRFRLDFDVRLNTALQALGMKRAFTRQADFSAMSDEPLYVSEVKQKSFVEVNEEGTEAAAVTVGVMRASAVLVPDKPFEMIVDRPFLFAISYTDGPGEFLLFTGVVQEPMAAEAQ